jgi:uncharacterized membrane protein
MSADKIVLYFSIFVVAFVLVWAYFMIRQYDKTGRN